MNLLPAFVGAPEVNKIYNCDALTLLKALPSGSVDCVVTSPPYDNLRTYNGYSFDFEAIAHESYRVLKTGGVLVWVVGDATVNGSETLTSMRQAIYFKDVVGFNVHDTMIYHKTGVIYPSSIRCVQAFEYMFVLSKGEVATFNPPMKKNRWAGDYRKQRTERKADGTMKIKPRVPTAEEGVMENVWTFDTGYMKTTLDLFAYAHPAMFPEALAERHILTWSNPGDLVLDYFMGSGTVAKMARNTGRNFIGCDISHEYVQICKERLRMPYEQHYITRESAPMADLPLFAANA